METTKKQDSFFLSKKEKYENRPDKQFHEQKQKHVKNSQVSQKSDTKDKKPFDKKTYRLKKYSKKYKLDKWEEQRKKRLLLNYYKDVKKDETAGKYKPKTFDDDATDSNEVYGKFVRHPDVIDKISKADNEKEKDPFWKAKEQFKKVNDLKVNKKLELEKIKEEKNKKLLEYKKKKQERFKKLSKKTKRGQPVMTGRLELLLEKLQK